MLRDILAVPVLTISPPGTESFILGEGIRYMVLVCLLFMRKGEKILNHELAGGCSVSILQIESIFIRSLRCLVSAQRANSTSFVGTINTEVNDSCSQSEP